MWVYAGKTLEKGNCWNQTCSWKTPLNKWLLEIASLVSETTLSLTKHFLYVFFLMNPNLILDCVRGQQLSVLDWPRRLLRRRWSSWSDPIHLGAFLDLGKVLPWTARRGRTTYRNTWINFSSSCYCSVKLKNLNPSDRRFQKSFLKGL